MKSQKITTLRFDQNENYKIQQQFHELKLLLNIVIFILSKLKLNFLKLHQAFIQLQKQTSIVEDSQQSLRIIHCISLNFIRTDYKVLHKSQKPKPSLLSKTFIQQTNQNFRTNEVNETECRPSIPKDYCKSIQLIKKSITITALNQNYILHL